MLSTTPPPRYSDHQKVELHLRVKQFNLEHTRRHHDAYPIRTIQTDRVLDDLVTEMGNLRVEHAPTAQTCDAHILDVQTASDRCQNGISSGGDGVLDECNAEAGSSFLPGGSGSLPTSKKCGMTI